MATAEPKAILALDYGSKRIGMAVSTALQTAQPLETLVRRERRDDIDYIKRTVKRYEVAAIVVGRPLSADGTEGEAALRAANFAELLRQKLGLPVHLQDERLTSLEAEAILRKSSKRERLKNEGKADQIAAVLILEAFLSHQSPSGVVSS